MSKVRSDWAVYEDLKAAVNNEIDDQAWGMYEDGEEPKIYLVAVSEDYNEVQVMLDPTDEERDEFMRKYNEDTGWHSVSTDDYFELVEDWLQLGLDLR